MEGDRKNVHIVMCTLVCKCLQSANATANSSHTMQPIQSYHELSHSPTLPGFTCVRMCVCVCVCVCVCIYLEFVGCPLMENKTIVQQPVDLLTLNYHMTNAGTNFIRRSVCKCMRATMHCMKE